MTSQNELRDRIARVLFERDQIRLERRGYFKMRWEESDAKYLRPWRREAQAIIDDLGLEVVSDGGRPEWKLQIVGKWEEAEEQEPRP